MSRASAYGSAVPLTETLTVSRFCYGAGGLGTVVTGEAVDRLVDRYLEAGGNCLDTAHCYCFWMPEGDGASEREVGRQVRRIGADRLLVATKGGHPAADGYPRPDRYMAPERIHADIEDSLARLGLDRIDLYWLHRDDPRESVESIIDCLNAECAAGRIRAFGASNWQVERVAEANAYARRTDQSGFVAVQVQWSLAAPNWHIADAPDPAMRSVTPGDAQWYRAVHMPVFAYSSTACGFFSDEQAPMASAFDNPLARARRKRAVSLAAELGCTPTQVALAWLLAGPTVVIPILGTVNMDHLTEALDAVQVKLTPQQVKYLVSGER